MRFAFNSSMPRAGSELLQVILSQHPTVFASATSPLRQMIATPRAVRETPEFKSMDPGDAEAQFRNMTRAMFTGFYEHVSEDVLVVDKARGWAADRELIEDLFGTGSFKVVCMVRDLRDVLASMERIYRKHPHSLPNHWKPGEAITVEERVRVWSQSLPVGPSTRVIREVLQKGDGDKVCFIRYEDLCTSPDEVMNKVADYLEIPRFSFDFDNLQKTVVERPGVFVPYGDHEVSKTLRQYRPGAWRDVIPAEVGAMIYEGNRWYNEAFNY